MSLADHRARFRIAGHVTGGMGDFAFLPAGTRADSAGAGALEPSWGWGTCCTYEGYEAAGAAFAWGADGKRYMSLFVRGGDAAIPRAMPQRSATRSFSRTRFRR
jgi:hypothetical protein